MTFAAEETEQILRQDARGRVLVTPERRELLLAEYDRSRMSRVKFAQYVGIKYSTLAYWRQQRRKEKSLIKPGADTKPGRSNDVVLVTSLANEFKLHQEKITKYIKERGVIRKGNYRFHKQRGCVATVSA